MEPAARVIPICFYRLMFLCGSGPPPPSKSEAQTAKQLHDAVTKNDSLTRELQAAQQAAYEDETARRRVFAAADKDRT